MSTLKEILSRPGARPEVIRDCEQIISEEVSSKGLTGIPIKAAYAVVKAIKPGFIPEVIDGLLQRACRRGCRSPAGHHRPACTAGEATSGQVRL